MNNMIPFCKTTLGNEEKKAVCDVIDSGWVAMGKKTQEFEEQFAQYIGSKFAVFVDSGTSALDLSIKYIKYFSPYLLDKFLCPSLTFTSTAEILVHNQMNLEFADVSLNDFCLENVSKNTLPVHLTGNRAQEGALIYDSAHRIIRNDVKDSKALWCYSFYATKNITTINGGMIATNDETAYEWLKLARDHGIDKGTTERYKEGNWGYSINFVGWREKSDDVHAAIGIEQLKKLDWINEQRQRCASLYNELLGLKRTGLHIYPILVNKRKEFIEFMRSKGIQCSVHFLPLHKMPAYSKWNKEYYDSEYDCWRTELPNTNYLGDRLVSLPLYPQLTNEEIKEVVKAIEESKLLIHE